MVATTNEYGPNTEAIQAIIERLKTMTLDEANALHKARHAAWSEAWKTAKYAALDAAKDWNAAKDSAWNAVWNAGRDAILALMVRDEITPEQFDLLYGPWKQVMEDTAK